jgi:cystathionine beta-synthase
VNNPLAHQLTTAPEIIEAVASTPPTPVHPSSGKVDVFVAGAGTGGTVSGVAKGIKKAHNPDCIVIGVDPVSHFLFLETVFAQLTRVPSGWFRSCPPCLSKRDR